MPETGYLAVFLVGLLGGVHCVSMCGGIVGALAVQMEQPLTGPMPRGWHGLILLHLAYNLGRIGTYTLMGGILGAVGSASMLYDNVMPVQIGLYVLANLMLIALGFYLAGFTHLLAPVERLGQRLWRHVQPATRRFLPARSVAQAFPLGLLWGFLPCGVVYPLLATALVTGSPQRGAALMLAFGLGTLPNLLLAGLAFRRFRDFTRNGKVRFAAGLLVLAFGIFGLIQTPSLGGKLWNGVMCA
ncbi:MAG: sulfite exporter TauE/SafE family protein [Azoarcus sp.]|jgi:sulfite exporter TauE/SafE|nr:sulfite exporter TauE/SafE family protein [Azoarcus sp.]